MVPPIRDKEPYLTALVASSRNTGQNGVASSGRNVTGSPSRRYREDHRSYKAQNELREVGALPARLAQQSVCARSGLQAAIKARNEVLSERVCVGAL
jgi:hypothetical protein